MAGRAGDVVLSALGRNLCEGIAMNVHSFREAVLEVVRRIDLTISPDYSGEVVAVMAGGAALHFHTSARTSRDVDLSFTPRVLVTEPIVVRYEEDGRQEAVALDRQFSPEIALLHPDYIEDAMDYCRIGRIRLKVMAPVDLALSKVGRYAGEDPADIARLAAGGLLETASLERRFAEAIPYYVGDTGRLRHNLRDALEEIAACSPRPR